MSDPNPPKVSVLLPVHNSGPHLAEAIDSLRRQSFTNYEVVAIDDGSTDGSDRLLRRVDDPRWTIVQQQHAGLTATLNRAWRLARGAAAGADGRRRPVPTRPPGEAGGAP